MNSEIQAILLKAFNNSSQILSLIPEIINGVIKKSIIDQILDTFKISIVDLQIRLLPIAAVYQITPISKFGVGVVALGNSGDVYFGSNIELPQTGLQFTIHAEQCALINAAQNGEKMIRSMAVNAAPCGFCRQFINELNGVEKLEIILPGKKPEKFPYFLPDSFSGRDLGIETGILNHPALNYKLEMENDGDALFKSALEAANLSYAPYSKFVSGVALRLKSGQIVGGSYYESAAFNPSVTSIQSALIRTRLNGEPFDGIQEAVLLQTDSIYCDYQKITTEILDTIAPDAIFTIGKIVEAN